MNSEAEDSEAMDGESGGNQAAGTGVPWYLPREDDGREDEEFDLAEAKEEAFQAEGGGSVEARQGILRVWCPECGQELNILREHLGMQGVCLKCKLPIVARMSPDDGGRMRVAVAEVAVLDGSTGDEADDEMSDDEPVSREVEGEEDTSDELGEVEGAADEAGGVDSSESGDGELGGPADPDEAGESEDVDTADGDPGPSWAKGGNPWDVLGLEERKSEESLDGKEEVGEGKVNGGDDSGEGGQGEDDSKPAEEDLEEELDLIGEETSDTKTDGGEGEEELDGDLSGDLEEGAGLQEQEQEDSRLGLIVAVVIILIVGGGGLTLYLKPDLIRGSSKVRDKAPTEELAKSDKPDKTEKTDNTGSKASTGVADKTDKADSGKTEVAAGEPKAIKRPDGKDKKPDSPTGEKPGAKIEPQPEMARARANVDDEVALRMHQEGERAIRSFYRAQSIEERSAFVLDPGRAVGSMRSFYGKLGKLPTIRYLEFKGKILDPTSGLRFGVFDVHEKENEKSHRWIVVEVEPGQYALDWGLYEQLENSTLASYLAKKQGSPKEFRLLMKLGDRVSAADNPWDEDAVKVYLQLPSAGEVEGEVVLLRKSAAEKLGILDGLGDGKIRIGRLTLDWVAGDKDPGSKAPTITGFDGWGAWAEMKMRGLN